MKENRELSMNLGGLYMPYRMIAVLIIFSLGMVGSVVSVHCQELPQISHSRSSQDAEVERAVSLVKKGDKKSIESALVIFRDLAEKENYRAVFYLGSMYLDGIGVEVSHKKARDLFRRASEHGEVNAQYNLANMIEQGLGGRKDIRETINWLRKASDGGHGAASNNLGVLYLDGVGVSVDEKTSAHYFNAAVRQGYLPAKRSLGLLYLAGRGVAVNIEKGITLLIEASQHGDLESAFDLASIYLSGKYGIPVDQRKALALFLRSAESGHPPSQYMTSYMYGKGLGTSRDIGQANKWMMAAANQGYSKAIEFVKSNNLK